MKNILRTAGALLLVLLSAPLARAETSDALQIQIALTTGERSKDSNSQTTTLTVEGGALVCERTSMGRGARETEALRKQVRLSVAEKENLLKLIRENNILTTDSIELPRAAPNFYFELSISSALDGKKGMLNLSGPRNAVSIKAEPLYQHALILINEFYRILHAHGVDIQFEEFVREP